MLKLLALNKGKGQSIKAETEGEEATIYVYDVIVNDDYWDGISAITFVKALNEITAAIIHIRLQCPGGDVFAARAMAQAIREHKSKIIVHVDGMAASAATFLVNAADESVISEGGMFMIHNAWTVAAGNAEDFIAAADLLARTDDTLIKEYVASTGNTEEQIKAWMTAETFFFGQEAVDNGFIDSVAEAVIKNQIDWDMSAYHKDPVKNKAKKQQDKQLQKPDLSAHYRQLQLIQLTA